LRETLHGSNRGETGQMLPQSARLFFICSVIFLFGLDRLELM